MLDSQSWRPLCASGRTEAAVRSIQGLGLIGFRAKFDSSHPSFLEGLQLDGYCNESSLASEYQEEQHYHPDNYFHFGSPIPPKKDHAELHIQEEPKEAAV